MWLAGGILTGLSYENGGHVRFEWPPALGTHEWVWGENLFHLLLEPGTCVVPGRETGRDVVRLAMQQRGGDAVLDLDI